MRRFLGFSAAVLCVYIALFRGTWRSLQQPRPAQLPDVAQLLAGQQRRRQAARTGALPALHGSSEPSVSGTVPRPAAKPPLKRSPESHAPAEVSAPVAATPPAFAGTAATVQVGAGVQLDFGPGLGVVRLHLRREWSPTSTAYASAVAEARLSASCAYRLEPGFLVQGSLMGGPGVTANRKNPRAPKVMERGEVGWAGGGKGPDYFIYMGSGPAGWLGIPHEGTIFAEVADEESMQVVTNVSLLPVPPVAPGVMHTLRKKLAAKVTPWLPTEGWPLAEGGEGWPPLERLLKVGGASLDIGGASECGAACHAQARTELHGDVVKWGKDHKQSSAASCCAACDAHRAEAAKTARRGCNVWVWCGAASCEKQKHECWLKHTKALWETPNLLLGTSDRWTAGSADAPPAEHPSGAGIRLPAAAEAHFALVFADRRLGRVRVIPHS